MQLLEAFVADCPPSVLCCETNTVSSLDSAPDYFLLVNTSLENDAWSLEQARAELESHASEYALLGNLNISLVSQACAAETSNPLTQATVDIYKWESTGRWVSVAASCGLQKFVSIPRKKHLVDEHCVLPRVLVNVGAIEDKAQFCYSREVLLSVPLYGKTLHNVHLPQGDTDPVPPPPFEDLVVDEVPPVAILLNDADPKKARDLLGLDCKVEIVVGRPIKDGPLLYEFAREVHSAVFLHGFECVMNSEALPPETESISYFAFPFCVLSLSHVAGDVPVLEILHEKDGIAFS